MSSAASIGRHSPTTFHQPVGDIGAVLNEPQVRDVWGILAVVDARRLAHLAQPFAATRQIFGIEEPGAEGFDRDAATRAH